MILLIDNYDSFVHNLARYLCRLGQETLVVRNDEVTPADVLRRTPAAIVLSPGPCTPAEAGASLDIVRDLAGQIPMLGVCLGHQTIGAAFACPDTTAGTTAAAAHASDHSARLPSRHRPGPKYAHNASLHDGSE